MGGVGGGGNAKRKSSEEGGRLLLSLTHLLDLVKLACWCVGMMGGAVMACVLTRYDGEHCLDQLSLIMPNTLSITSVGFQRQYHCHYKIIELYNVVSRVKLGSD